MDYYGDMTNKEKEEFENDLISRFNLPCIIAELKMAREEDE